MGFKIFWTPTAEQTFSDEIDFILVKWNESAVVTFINLVDNCLVNLQAYPYLGQLIKNKGIHRFVISKQTTLFYKVYPESERIDLILFYNNLLDPKILHKYF